MIYLVTEISKKLRINFSMILNFHSIKYSFNRSSTYLSQGWTSREICFTSIERASCISYFEVRATTIKFKLDKSYIANLLITASCNLTYGASRISHFFVDSIQREAFYKVCIAIGRSILVKDYYLLRIGNTIIYNRNIVSHRRHDCIYSEILVSLVIGNSSRSAWCKWIASTFWIIGITVRLKVQFLIRNGLSDR